MSSNAINELSVSVPVDLVKRSTGLSIDFGGSVFKVVYRSKENRKEAENKDAKLGHFQLISFPRSIWENALDYIKEHADISRNGNDLPTIHTTGVGCTSDGKIISDKLCVQLKQVTEFDCFVHSFQYLASKLSRSEFLHPYQTEASKEIIEAVMEQMALVSNQSDSEKNCNPFNPLLLTGEVFTERTDAPLTEAENIYPCLLAMFGSGVAFMQVNEDKSFRLVGGTFRGGRSMYGIARLLTGCKSYDEFIDLALKGDPRHVDLFSNDLFDLSGAAEGDQSFYANYAEAKHKTLIFPFGKSTDQQTKEFKHEDLARAWLNYAVCDLVQTLQLTSRANSIRRVFFAGSFCNTEIVRKIMTEEICRLNLSEFMLGIGEDGPVQYDFMIPGAYLGAIGAMLHHLN